MSDEECGSRIRFGRDVCCDLGIAERREWLVTNGLGGYACGTVPGLLTRRYHGLLVAATNPPVGRTLLFAKIDETVTYLGRTSALAVNRCADGTIDPAGHLNLESFHLDGTAPVWRYAIADAVLEKRLWMTHGSNATSVRYFVERASGPLELACKLFVDDRDHHGSSRAGSRPAAELAPAGIRWEISGSAVCSATSEAASWALDNTWYYGFDLARERERGLDDRDDHLCGAVARITLAPHEECVFEIQAPGGAPSSRWHDFAAREADLVARWRRSAGVAAGGSAGWIEQLVLASDQFIVERPEGRTVIAGYPWFTDWGRDTMIALPGLTLAAGRPEIAASILRAYSRYVDQGMIPNRFADAGGAPEFNTADATLWYFHAVREYLDATGDEALVEDLFDVLAECVACHVRGTRFGIHVDPEDGLLAAGEPGAQLTWMDAKVGDWVVTPRIGKPVEICALWHHALRSMARFADVLGRHRAEYDRLAETAAAGFARFWNPSEQYCFDVLDSPNGPDASMRPNQIIAAALPDVPLSPDQLRAVVDACGRELLVSYGLRSVAASDPSYQGRYEGDPMRRDRAYHQGTAWGWLLGPFAIAHFRAYGDARAARAMLAPMEDAMRSYGLGTLGEIFDGDAPFVARGCIAQAWTVAEVLRCSAGVGI